MLCKDCKYFSAAGGGECRHPSSATSVSLQTGYVHYMTARKMRQPSRCGDRSPRYFIHVDDIMPPDELPWRFCVNCKYLQRNPKWFADINQVEYGLCMHPRATCIDMVTGVPDYAEAKEMRKDKSCKIDELHLCTSHALYFEPHEEAEAAEEAEGNAMDAGGEQPTPLLIILCIILILLL